MGSTIHFVGIAGSGVSSVAAIAHARGYAVSGCDRAAPNDYSRILESAGICVDGCHHVSHADGVDIVAASPAVLEQWENIPELRRAHGEGRLMSWQAFLGEHLLEGQCCIAIAGTHGKTTTTAMLALMLERGGIDPTVMVGGKVTEWAQNARIGQSRYWVCEADEYNYNFLNYRPSLLLLNNVEFEHPEFFKDMEAYCEAFRSCIRRVQDGGVIFAGAATPILGEMLGAMASELRERRIDVVHFGVNAPAGPNRLSGEILDMTTAGARFKVTEGIAAHEMFLAALGEHNVHNALGAIAIARHLGVDWDTVRDVLRSFGGVGRRLERKSEGAGVMVFDDYGHHPTEVAATLEGLRVHHPGATLMAVFEPHQLSRIVSFFDGYADALRIADRVFITKPFKGREAEGASPELLGALRDAVGRDKAELHSDFESTASAVVMALDISAVVVVFGAGESPKLTQQIVAQLPRSV